MRQSQPPSIPPCQGGRKNSLPKTDFSSSPDKGRRGRGFENTDEPDHQHARTFLSYNKKLIALARENRKNPTPAETKIWNEVLRMRQFAALKFLRQKPIDKFIVDFYCSELRLVIEIDGESHAENIAYDAERTKILQSLGVTVVRYTNQEIMTNMNGVYDNLSEVIAGIQPPSVPPCQGGGDRPLFDAESGVSSSPDKDPLGPKGRRRGGCL